MGNYLFLNRTVVSWSNKKQKIISTSIIKAEYIVFEHIVKEAVWIKRFINEMELEAIVNLILYGDNEINIVITKDIESQHYTINIDI